MHEMNEGIFYDPFAHVMPGEMSAPRKSFPDAASQTKPQLPRLQESGNVSRDRAVLQVVKDLERLRRQRNLL